MATATDSQCHACPICCGGVKFMADHPESTLHRCIACGHAFSHPKLADGVEQYNDEYYEVEHRRWFENPHYRLFAHIASLIPNDARHRRIVDVGCGRGDFLRYLAKTRQNVSLTGIDVSNRDPPDGIRYIRGDVLSTQIDDVFDVVVSLAVIEHVPDVQKFAARLGDLCRPGGLVFVMTVNESSLRRLACGMLHVSSNRLRAGVSRHHVHHFTEASLKLLLQSRGMTVVSHFNHNGLLAATDLPTSSTSPGFILRCGLAGVMLLGRLTNTMYLQTVACRPKDSDMRRNLAKSLATSPPLEFLTRNHCIVENRCSIVVDTRGCSSRQAETHGR